MIQQVLTIFVLTGVVFSTLPIDVSPSERALGESETRRLIALDYPCSIQETVQKGTDPLTPLDIVNQRMDAYNAHNIEEFMRLYDEEVEIFRYPERSMGQGKAHMRSIFEPMFEEKKVHVEIHHQIAKDGYVVNHETVDYGDSKTEYVSIYEVRNGLIKSVRFVRD